MKKTFAAVAASSLTALALVAGVAFAQTTVKPSSTMTTVNCKASLKAKIMLNTAKADELMCLPNVTKAVVADFIKERPFKSDKDFLNRIEGGRKLWTAISPYVMLK